jgi:hypothetical protein
MRLDTLIRVGGGAAIFAGVLRVVGSFTSGGSEVARQSLYFIVTHATQAIHAIADHHILPKFGFL